MNLLNIVCIINFPILFDIVKFGDVTKKVLGNLFGKRKRGGDGN